RGDLQRLARGHGVRTLGDSLEKHRLARLGKEVAGIVRGGAIDAEAQGHARVTHRPDRRDAGAEAAVRAGAMGDAGPAAGEKADFAFVEPHAMGVPDIGTGPAQVLGILARPARSEEHTSELQSRENLVCRLLLEKKKK